jgi:hypothetical protein
MRRTCAPDDALLAAVVLVASMGCQSVDDVVFRSGERGPSGLPVAPPSSPAPSGLPAHPLHFAPAPTDNPDKGLAPYYRTGGVPSGFPHSLEWSYVALDSVMTAAGVFDWRSFDAMRGDVASRGNRLAVRPYIEYPGKPSALPAFLVGSVPVRRNDAWGTDSPDYDDPQLVRALRAFIEEFGARYDGDPRLAFVQLGLVGLWGEWQTWPYDGTPATGRPNFMPTLATQTALVDTYVHAWRRTSLEVRFASTAGGHAVASGIGMHDNSWCFRESREGSAPFGTTLPVSMGGWNDSFLQITLDTGAENVWTGASIGGEVRSEIQSVLFAGGSQVDDVAACADLTHVTWLVDEQGVSSYGATDPSASALVHRMGYELTVDATYFDDNAFATSSDARLAVAIENAGVARFSYPWAVIVGARDGSGNVGLTWTTDWDLRAVQPSHLRPFPDWRLPGGPMSIPFGSPRIFETMVSLSGLVPGPYDLVLRVVSPLEAVSPTAKKIRFANAEQGDTWLVLGSFRR